MPLPLIAAGAMTVGRVAMAALTALLAGKEVYDLGRNVSGADDKDFNKVLGAQNQIDANSHLYEAMDFHDQNELAKLIESLDTGGREFERVRSQHGGYAISDLTAWTRNHTQELQQIAQPTMPGVADMAAALGLGGNNL